MLKIEQKEIWDAKVKYLATFSSPLMPYYTAVMKLSRYSDTGGTLKTRFSGCP